MFVIYIINIYIYIYIYIRIYTYYYVCMQTCAFTYRPPKDLTHKITHNPPPFHLPTPLPPKRKILGKYDSTC